MSSTVFLAAEALKLGGTTAQRQAWLPQIAAGDLIGCFAGMPQDGVPPTYASGRLKGCVRPVLDGEAAHIAIVAALRSDGSVVAVLTPLDQPGVRRRRLESVDPSRDVAELVFEDIAAEPLAAMGEGEAFLATLRRRAAILMAFEQVGGAERALYQARDYALARKTFGRPIGSYQAIKHKLANVYIKLETARAHAHYAAWALSTDAPDLTLAAAAARSAATDAFCFAAQENIQVHGGIGFTWEADCQLFYRRSRLLALQLGGPIAWKDAIVTELTRSNQSQ